MLALSGFQYLKLVLACWRFGLGLAICSIKIMLWTQLLSGCLSLTSSLRPPHLFLIFYVPESNTCSVRNIKLLHLQLPSHFSHILGSSSVGITILITSLSCSKVSYSFSPQNQWKTERWNLGHSSLSINWFQSLP